MKIRVQKVYYQGREYFNVQYRYSFNTDWQQSGQHSDAGAAMAHFNQLRERRTEETLVEAEVDEVRPA